MVGARGRILVITARVGAGHNGSAQELARRLTGYGIDVECHDFMDLLPGRTGRASLRGYNRILRFAPWIFAMLFSIGDHPATTALTRALLAPARGRILRLVGSDVRAVVSTYPLASQVLGSLRRDGRLRVPVITYATDFAVHQHWVAPGVDAHLTSHAVGADRARELGGRGARAAGALVAPGFRPTDAAGQLAARRAFGLPPGRLALVVAGSWGVGNVAATAAEVQSSGAATPIVVCGRNEHLRQRLRQAGVRHALGWVDDMPTLIQAVDVLIENAGGLMALEGMACGVPVTTYRPIPGHGRLNAAALARAGISSWIRRPESLGPALADLMDGDRSRRQHAAARQLFDKDAAMPVARLVAAHPTSVHTRLRPDPTARMSGAHIMALMGGIAAAVGVVGYLVRRHG
jgi:UDP-N-acetylglucosamine:LPS N-acetylglucosamine transferase